MLEKPVRILIVGLEGPHLRALHDRFAREGWGSYSVLSHSEARTVFETLRFDVVLASEYLVDGTGYDLAREVSRRFATLFVEVAVSEGQLWVPVVRYGVRTLGDSALDRFMFEWELRSLFSHRNAPGWRAGPSTNATVESRPRLKTTLNFDEKLPDMTRVGTTGEA